MSAYFQQQSNPSTVIW